ncbi:MAG: biopolymer transporter ExbD [Muribaculaceae bacterium]|mgnify:FL=1|nr:biopolymer transporter ExbD [Muribaculaceae bacterium]
MGKVKIKKKSTFIDMTAMSDVTVLLLTFFMLTSTFLQKEPVIVNTPASVSELKVPDQNSINILISPKGQVFLSIAGDADTTYSSENMRKELIVAVMNEYNKYHKSNPVKFTQAQVNAFGKVASFGYPIAKLGEFLDLDVAKQDETLDPNKNPLAGIPININQDLEHPNEFQIWMRALYNSSNGNLTEAIKTGAGISIKADKDTPYEIVNVVMDNLQTLKMNKFSLMTALKTEED